MVLAYESLMTKSDILEREIRINIESIVSYTFVPWLRSDVVYIVAWLESLYNCLLF